MNRLMQEENKVSNKVKVPLVELSASLVSPGVAVTPPIDEVQDAILRIAKIILSTARGVSQWLRGRKDEVLIFSKIS